MYVNNFSKISRQAFQLFLRDFSLLTPELILYHALPPLYDSLGVESYYPLNSRKDATIEMLAWVKEAESVGIGARYIIEENNIRSKRILFKSKSYSYLFRLPLGISTKTSNVVILSAVILTE